MGANAKRDIEKFEADYAKIASKDAWNKDDISMMKDLKKLIYYSKVICAMDEGTEYPGSEYMPDMRSFARSMPSRNPSNGQFMSGMYHYPDMPYSYDDGMGRSGRRYYDSEKEKAIHKLHHMMDMEDNPEKKNALQLAIHELEEKR